jgi:hypothetical protein
MKKATRDPNIGSAHRASINRVQGQPKAAPGFPASYPSAPPKFDSKTQAGPMTKNMKGSASSPTNSGMTGND